MHRGRLTKPIVDVTSAPLTFSLDRKQTSTSTASDAGAIVPEAAFVPEKSLKAIQDKLGPAFSTLWLQEATCSGIKICSRGCLLLVTRVEPSTTSVRGVLLSCDRIEKRLELFEALDELYGCPRKCRRRNVTCNVGTEVKQAICYVIASCHHDVAAKVSQPLPVSAQPYEDWEAEGLGLQTTRTSTFRDVGVHTASGTANDDDVTEAGSTYSSTAPVDVDAVLAKRIAAALRTTRGDDVSACFDSLVEHMKLCGSSDGDDTMQAFTKQQWVDVMARAHKTATCDNSDIIPPEFKTK